MRLTSRQGRFERPAFPTPYHLSMRFPFSAGRRRLTFGAGAAALIGGPRAMAAREQPPTSGADTGAAPAAPLDAAPALGTGAWAHAWAAFGEPKYPRGYDHFE